MTGPTKWEVSGAPLAHTHKQQWNAVQLQEERLVYDETVMVMLNELEPNLVDPIVRQINLDAGRRLDWWDEQQLLRR